MKNDGISFGLQLPGMTLLVGIVVVAIIIAAIRKRSWGLGLMALGGGLNLVERIRWGYVTDYWKIPIIPLYNNINDWIIFIGLVVYLWQMWRHQK